MTNQLAIAEQKIAHYKAWDSEVVFRLIMLGVIDVIFGECGR